MDHESTMDCPVLASSVRSDMAQESQDQKARTLFLICFLSVNHLQDLSGLLPLVIDVELEVILSNDYPVFVVLVRTQVRHTQQCGTNLRVKYVNLQHQKASCIRFLRRRA
jgi:hypothetical protein